MRLPWPATHLYLLPPSSTDSFPSARRVSHLIFTATMRFRTLEIRWHDSKPISTCDFQPSSFKKARPQQQNGGDGMEWAEKWAEQKYRLATGGEDNHVRVRWGCPLFDWRAQLFCAIRCGWCTRIYGQKAPWRRPRANLQGRLASSISLL